MSSQKTVLVTGGNGLVGEAMQSMMGKRPRKDEKWVFLSAADADLTDLEQVKGAFEKHKPTHVMHLAAECGGVLKNMAHPVEMWRENVAINDNVMRCAKDGRVEKLVSCMCNTAFPAGGGTGAVTEACLQAGPPDTAVESYAYAKRMLDVMSRAYRREYGCNFVCVVPSDIYGPHDNFSLQAGHPVATLIHKCLRAKREGTPLTVAAASDTRQQYMFSEDIAELLEWTMNNYNEDEPILLSVDEADAVSNGELAALVAKALSFDGEIVFECSNHDAPSYTAIDNAKMRRYLPDAQFASLRTGIERTAQWFVENYDCARK